MKQEQIYYEDIMKLGFKEEQVEDEAYYSLHGFDYSIITKKLTKKIYLEWAKETKLCQMIRIDNPKNGIIKAEMPIRDLDHLKEVINFYCDK